MAGMPFDVTIKDLIEEAAAERANAANLTGASSAASATARRPT